MSPSHVQKEVLRLGKAPVGGWPMKTCSTVQAVLGWEGALAPGVAPAHRSRQLLSSGFTLMEISR